MKQRWPEAVSESKQRPIFVLSAGWRSGSTLLQRMLHPMHFLWGEPYGHATPIEAMADVFRSFTDHWPQDEFISRQYEGNLHSRFIANLYPDPARLVNAHLSFFQDAFIDPASSVAAPNAGWGIKAVRWDADIAAYLRFLFPHARFLLLYRNPFDAFRSWNARRESGQTWYRRWPDEPLTPELFGRHWRRLVESFLVAHGPLDAMLVQYEAFVRRDWARIEEYLGRSLNEDAFAVRPKDGPTPLRTISDRDLFQLQTTLGDLPEELGYVAGK